MKLSDNFTLAEFIKSQTALRLDIDNTPDEEHLDAAMTLFDVVVQPVRDHFGPTTINSGYRGPELNKAVGGSSKSQHCKGEAADLQCHNNLELFNIIKDYLVFDQLIYEHTGPTGPAWVHVSYKKEGNRGQILQAISMGGRTQYVPYKL